jgi:hypothetical protein
MTFATDTFPSSLPQNEPPAQRRGQRVQGADLQGADLVSWFCMNVAIAAPSLGNK